MTDPHDTLIIEQDGQPTVAATACSVADFVHRAHEEGLDAVVRPSLATPKAARMVDTDQAETILTYCAEQRCSTAGVVCGACRLQRRQGAVNSLDDYIDQFASVHIGDDGRSVVGNGSGELKVASFEHLARDWAGEEYWFWARRVLRKLRYGVRQVDDLIERDTADLGAAPAVLLVAPQIPENIGMVARAMGNFAIDDLRIITPRDGWPSEKARTVASGAAAIIDGAGLHDDLGSAVADLTWVVATTARQRDMRKPVLTPEDAAREIRERISRGERCGIMFGRERNGLENDEVALADAIVMIPINNRFASLNLAQSVLLLGYEWMKAAGGASLGRVTTNERPIEPGVNLGNSRPATKQELFGLFEHLERELADSGFFNPSHRRHVVVRNIRTMLTRMEATEQEVRTLRGIVATLTRGKGKDQNTPE